MQQAISLLGVFSMVGVAWGLSSEKRRMPWRIVLLGTGMQFLFGVVVLRTSFGRWVFSVMNDVVLKVLSFTHEGSRFLFGDYLDLKFSMALNVLPTIIFFSSLMTLAYHLNLMQPVVRAIAWLMQRTLKTSGAETLSTAANIFVGQTEAPLVVKPFIAKMTESELMAVMVGGFASVAGGVLAAFVGMLHEQIPNIAGHLMAASVMSAPAALVVAKVMIPETRTPETANSVTMHVERPDANAIDAAARGASEGLFLALNVAAMLIAFMAIVALINYVLGLIWAPLSMQLILGWVFWPFAFAMGIPANECTTVATLLGEKTVLNEFVAYGHLAELVSQGVTLSERSRTIASYALCGFANFGSIAIQIGGIGGMAPERRGDIARLGLRAMIGGTLAAFMTACVAGVLL